MTVINSYTQYFKLYSFEFLKYVYNASCRSVFYQLNLSFLFSLPNCTAAGTLRYHLSKIIFRCSSKIFDSPTLTFNR